VPVLPGVLFCRFVVMMLGLKMVTMGDVSVMGGFLVVARHVLLSGLVVMVCRVSAVFTV
jgi:hypothetical protein